MHWSVSLSRFEERYHDGSESPASLANVAEPETILLDTMSSYLVRRVCGAGLDSILDRDVSWAILQPHDKQTWGRDALAA